MKTTSSGVIGLISLVDILGDAENDVSQCREEDGAGFKQPTQEDRRMSAVVFVDAAMAWRGFQFEPARIHILTHLGCGTLIHIVGQN